MMFYHRLMGHEMKLLVHKALRILHDVILRILTNTRQLRSQIDMILVSLASDDLYLLMRIMENDNESK
ncbi:unnamed protein product [Rotaria sp. Silwood1]|nr:unnamed protein product [Rotaria sp. Silwood1]CAF5061788.1 unnamed protein product [Rotaria sp. Silwood1]